MTDEQVRVVVTTSLWLAALGLAANEPKFYRQHLADAVEVITGFWAPDLVPEEGFHRSSEDS